jgi:hypothetical protein
MAYVPDWERLSDALKRVMAADVSEDEAKLGISRAIADRKIPVRLILAIEQNARENWSRMVQGAQGLAPPPVWKRLGDALAPLTAIGIDEAQSKRNICRAIADHRIKIRLCVARKKGINSFGKRSAFAAPRSDEIEIPKKLEPNDFDWQQSRPLKPWQVAGKSQSARAGSRQIEWIEVLVESGDEATVCFDSTNVKVPPHLTSANFDWENSRPLSTWPVRPRGGRPDEWRSVARPAILIELSVSDVRKVLCVGEQPNKSPEQPSPTTKQETDAIKALAAHLEKNRDLKRNDAATWCHKNGYNVSGRGLKYRVWPAAREKAKLSRKASAGRKKSARA